MELTHLKVSIANPVAPEVMEEVNFLIDSGAIYSVVPREILIKLDIKPLSIQEFRLADGSVISRPKGGAVFRYGKNVGAAAVIFGEPGDAALLGAHTLEALGLGLDPLKRELMPLPLLLM
ncbi:MAG: aspartyl protease [Calditrichota bacterium]